MTLTEIGLRFGVCQSGVDRGLVAMFLRMSPEERLQANDNALRTILELRDAYRRQKANERNYVKFWRDC